MPLESRSVVSIESVSRLRMSGFITSRSTTTSIVCLLLLVEVDLLAQFADHAVDADAREALLADLLEELRVLALAAADDRREQLDARAFGQLHDLIDDLLGSTAR